MRSFTAALASGNTHNSGRPASMVVGTVGVPIGVSVGGCRLPWALASRRAHHGEGRPVTPP